MENRYLREAQKNADQIIAHRRDFHKHAEIGFNEFRTAERIAAYLQSLDLEVQTGIAQTGVVGLLRCGEAGKTAALRADIDALPMQEKNDSENRESLLKIQEAEKKAEKLVSDANSKREKILEQARLDSIETAKQIGSEAEKARADLLAKTRKKITAEKSSLTAKNEEEVKKLKSKAATKSREKKCFCIIRTSETEGKSAVTSFKLWLCGNVIFRYFLRRKTQREINFC